MSNPHHVEALARARLSLQGLSIGDAFGETFFTRHSIVEERLRTRSAPPGPWPWTDDTAMAVSIVEELAANGGIDRDSLARRFADRYLREPARGNGDGAHRLLSALTRVSPGGWRHPPCSADRARSATVRRCASPRLAPTSPTPLQPR